jgi:replicative DNA helicase
VANLPIYIDDTATMTTIELKAKARRMKRVNNVGLIIIDYLQLMSSDSKSRGNREQEISKISRELKLLAKTLEIPIIALSQLNRAVEGRADSEPKLADLRDSGAIEQDADMVMFLFGHPKDFLKKNTYKYSERMLTIAKHRDGKLAAFTFDFDGSKQRFEKEDIQMMDAHFTEVPNDFARPIKAEISHAPNLLPLHQPHEGVGNDELPF